MNESEFPGGQGQPVSGGPQNQPAEPANPVMFSSEDASASASAQPIFDNSNSFDAPQAAISSDAGDEVAPSLNASTSHLFGNRFRRNATRRAEESTFVPNPNAPDFFNNAMAAMTPAKEPKSGKGLKIAIIAVVAILVIGGGVLAAVMLSDGGGEEPTVAENNFDNLPEDAKAFLSDEDFETAMLFEGGIEDLSTKEQDSIWEVAGVVSGDMSSRYEKYKQLVNKISTYDTSRLNDVQKQVFLDVDETAKRMMPIYDQLIASINIISSAAKDGDASSIKKLQDSSNDDLKKIGEIVENTYASYREAEGRYRSLGCGERGGDPDCEEIYGQMADVEDMEGASELFFNYVKSLNGNKAFSDSEFIHDDIIKLHIEGELE